MGLGLYHSGIEVNGREYAFGGHDMEGTGVFENEPRQAYGAVFREAIPLGKSKHRAQEIPGVIEELATEFSGVSYNLFTRNCNNFSDALGERLTGKRAPQWINRLASYGESIKCFLPPGVDSPHMAPVQAPQASIGYDRVASEETNNGGGSEGTGSTGIDYDTAGRLQESAL
eukprot:CAMPEP_0184752342 /NCGR_PEP_ID=MMETSP0315-20130426/43530_1 /TAXON_ID=101924 /ORGANISM="Rhodosorus marinus, Strain UTEX LB 2760" /LENGTH=171 /DNA_ID=CAMNT_0027231669 /DNA_START=198 /DNA_END=713 /DNA_ORIENTATION=-